MLSWFRFKFYTGQVFEGCGIDHLDALKRLGLGAYNAVAYEWEEITGG